MREILPALERWYAAGAPFGLATVVTVSRSAPGTREPPWPWGPATRSWAVSGGCVEGAVYELAQEVVATGEARPGDLRVQRRGRVRRGPHLRRRDHPAHPPGDAREDPSFAAVADSVAAGRPVTVATVIEGPAPLGATLAVWPRTRWPVRWARPVWTWRSPPTPR